MEKRDIHDTKGSFNSAWKNLEADTKIKPFEKKRIKKFIDDCMIGKNMKKKVGQRRLMSYINQFRYLARYFKKDFKRLTDKDTEVFYRDMETDKIRRQDGKPYSANSKNELIKTLKKYARWLHTDNVEKYNKTFRWLKEFNTEVETPALTRTEIEKMVNASDIRDKALIMVLFDGGMRIEELFNVRLCDIKKCGDGNDYYYMVFIRYSKTKSRTISLPLCTKYLDAWFNEHPEGNNKDAFLFPMSYGAARMTLSRKGKLINKRVHPHLMRHSSATFYANKLRNPFKLDYRYGWVIGSKMARRYIDREGLMEEETPNIIKGDEMNNLKRENQKLQEDMNIMREEYNKITSFIEDLKNNLGITEENIKRPTYRDTLKQGIKEIMIKGRR